MIVTTKLFIMLMLLGGALLMAVTSMVTKLQAMTYHMHTSYGDSDSGKAIASVIILWQALAK